MMYALTPDPPTSSVEAVQERSTWPQLAALAMRAVGAEGGITSAAISPVGANSDASGIPNTRGTGTPNVFLSVLNLLEPILAIKRIRISVSTDNVRDQT